MKKFKGTLGQWEIKHSKSKDAWNIVGTKLGERYKVAVCPYIREKELSIDWNTRELCEQKANAQLISKAPELLEAMQEFCDRVDKGEVRSTKTYNKFKQLIQEATT